MAKKRANGEGNIRKRKDGRWEGRYTAGYDPATGKRIIKNVLGKTQVEIKEKPAAAMDDAKDLDVARSEDYTVGSWLTNWYTLYAKPNVRVSAAEYYRRSIELHVNPRIGDIKLNKLAGRDLQKPYQDLRENGRLREVQKTKFPAPQDNRKKKNSQKPQFQAVLCLPYKKDACGLFDRQKARFYAGLRHLEKVETKVLRKRCHT